MRSQARRSAAGSVRLAFVGAAAVLSPITALAWNSSIDEAEARRDASG